MVLMIVRVEEKKIFYRVGRVPNTELRGAVMLLKNGKKIKIIVENLISKMVRMIFSVKINIIK